MFSCEYCKILRTPKEHLQMTASAFSESVFQELLWCRLLHPYHSDCFLMKQKWSLAVWKVFKSIMIEQNLSYHNIPDKEKKDIRDAWMKAIARTVLPKAETLK